MNVDREALAKDLVDVQPIQSIGRILGFLADLKDQVEGAPSPPPIAQTAFRSRAFVASIVPRLLSNHNLTTARLYQFTNWLQLVLKQAPAFEEPPALGFAPPPKPKARVAKARRRAIEEVEDEIELVGGKPTSINRRRTRLRSKAEATETKDGPRQRQIYRVKDLEGHREVPMAFRYRRKADKGQLVGEELDLESDSPDSLDRPPRWKTRGGRATLAGAATAAGAGLWIADQTTPQSLLQPKLGEMVPGISSANQSFGRTSARLADSLILRNGARGAAGLSHDLLQMRADPAKPNPRKHSPVSAHPRLGFVTLVSSPVKVKGKEATNAGVDATFHMKDLSRGARPLTFDDLKQLKQTLPAGAKALYPSLHPNELGPSAVNVPISAEVIDALLEHEGDQAEPGFGNKVVSLSWPTPVMSALQADLGLPGQVAGQVAGHSGGPSYLGHGRTHRWSGNYYPLGGGPSVLRTLGLPLFLPGGVNRAHPLSHTTETRKDLRMVPVAAISASSFAQMRQQAFPSFHSVLARPSAAVTPRVMPALSSAPKGLRSPLITAFPSPAIGSSASPRQAQATKQGAPSRSLATGNAYPTVTHIPALTGSVQPSIPSRSPVIPSATPAPPTIQHRPLQTTAASQPMVRPIVPSISANMIKPPTISLPKVPVTENQAPPEMNLHLESLAAPKVDLVDPPARPTSTLVSASLSRPSMPVKRPAPQDEPALAVQTSRDGIGSTSPSNARVEEQASQSGGAKAKDQDVTLLATEVWSILKRKLQFEAERAGLR